MLSHLKSHKHVENLHTCSNDKKCSEEQVLKCLLTKPMTPWKLAASKLEKFSHCNWLHSDPWKAWRDISWTPFNNDNDIWPYSYLVIIGASFSQKKVFSNSNGKYLQSTGFWQTFCAMTLKSTQNTWWNCRFCTEMCICPIPHFLIIWKYYYLKIYIIVLSMLFPPNRGVLMALFYLLWALCYVLHNTQIYIAIITLSQNVFIYVCCSKILDQSCKMSNILHR